jgi:hypothetical protein
MKQPQKAKPAHKYDSVYRAAFIGSFKRNDTFFVLVGYKVNDIQQTKFITVTSKSIYDDITSNTDSFIIYGNSSLKMLRDSEQTR